jgi:hypothetical protein
MQRFACLLIGITAACGGSGADTGEASLSGLTPPVKSAAASVFTGADGDGNMVMGWTIDLFEDGPGADCASSETNVIASIGIFTNQAAGSKPQPILPVGGISIVTMSPPSLTASANVATMGAENVASIVGQVTITEFHLTADAMHADRIKGTIAAGGKDAGTGADVLMNGEFTAPFCDL